MDWDDIRIFLAVARAGTLAGAARITELSQPTMGRHILALEAAVGHTLFQRTDEGFIPTDEGYMLLGHAEKIEGEIQSLRRRLEGNVDALSGVLRISSSDWFGNHILSPIIADFRTHHPNVTVELITDARLLNLARREADIAIRIKPFEEQDVVQQKLIHMNYGVYAATDFSAPKAGDGLGCSLITMDSGFADFPDAKWLRKLLPNAAIGFGSNSREAQAMHCKAGAGVGVLPCLLAQRIAGLQRLDLGEEPPGRDVFIGYHYDLRQLGRLRKFVAFLQSHPYLHEVDSSQCPINFV